MDFECSNTLDGKLETWKCIIKSYSISEDFFEMHVNGRSSLHIIIGKSKQGNFVCVPNFNIGCYLSRFNDTLWNTERLTPLIGSVDAATVATAIQYIEDKLLLWDYF